jgi:hypothetical protein
MSHNEFTDLLIGCDTCNRGIRRRVKVWGRAEYQGTILCSFWCPHCHTPQVIRYLFKDTLSGPIAELSERLPVKSVYVARSPGTGITISARNKSRILRKP